MNAASVGASNTARFAAPRLFAQPPRPLAPWSGAPRRSKGAPADRSAIAVKEDAGEDDISGDSMRPAAVAH